MLRFIGKALGEDSRVGVLYAPAQEPDSSGRPMFAVGDLS